LNAATARVGSGALLRSAPSPSSDVAQPEAFADGGGAIADPVAIESVAETID